MGDLVPSELYGTAADAWRAAAAGAYSISGAVAFVTSSGVDAISALLPESRPELHIVARGAPVTEQAALRRLRDELAAEVSVVMGPDASRFHPKIWLFRRPDRTFIL
jgi:hypothetical protein